MSAINAENLILKNALLKIK